MALQSDINQDDGDLSSSPSSDNLFRSASEPRDQFEFYMAAVKKTPLLSASDLSALARESYVHRFGMIKTLSMFPACVKALIDQFEEISSRGHRLYNFARGYGDQSVEACDDLFSINSGESSKVDGFLTVKNNRENEALLRRTLTSLAGDFEAYRSSTPSERASSVTLPRKRMSEVYRYVILRYEEFERHCQLFEGLTSELQRFADLLFQLVDETHHDNLLSDLGSNQIESVLSTVPPAVRKERAVDFSRLADLLDEIGLSLAEAIQLRATYDHHKAEHTRLVNRIVESNLLLAAREAVRLRPADDRIFDICQVANEGLIVAASRFEYWRGYAFSTYACWWIRQKIGRERASAINGVVSVPLSLINKASKIRKAEQSLCSANEPARVNAAAIAKETSMSLGAVYEAMGVYAPALPMFLETACVDPSSPHYLNDRSEYSSSIHSYHIDDRPDVSTSIHSDELAAVVREAISTLPDRKGEVVRMRWGIGYRDQMTLSEVSRETGMTKARIRNIEVECIRLLRQGPFGERLHELFAC